MHTDVQSSVARRISQPAGSPIPLFSALLEVLWAYPWLIWISSWTFLDLAKPPLSLWAALAVIILAEEASRYFLAKRWPLALVRLITVLVLLTALALAMRIELGGGVAIWELGGWQLVAEKPAALFVAIPLGVFLLWRGISIGRTTLTFDDLYQKFFFGLTALVLLFIVWGLSSGGGNFSRIVASTSLFVVAFFFVSLMGLAIVNLQSGQRGMLSHEMLSSLTSRNWLSLYLVIILGIIGISGLLAFAFSRDAMGWVVTAFSVLGNALLTVVFYVVVIPIGYIVSIVFYFVGLLLKLFGATGEPPKLNLIDFSEIRARAQGPAAVISPEAILALKWFLVALVIGVVLFILARALFRTNRTEQAEEETVHESLWSWAALRQEIRYLAISLITWLYKRKPPRPVPIAPPIATMQEPTEEHHFTVREIYEGVLWEGRGAGAPRRASVTPYEYEQLLRLRFTGATSELQAITQAFVADRYGGLSPQQSELRLLNRLWRQVRTIFRASHEQPAQRPASQEPSD